MSWKGCTIWFHAVAVQTINSLCVSEISPWKQQKILWHHLLHRVQEGEGYLETKYIS